MNIQSEISLNFYRELKSLLEQPLDIKYIKDSNEIIDENSFTCNYLLIEIKERMEDYLRRGFVIKGPNDPGVPSFKFFDSKSITDIFITDSGNPFISIEIKILYEKRNRHQALSTAIGQSFVQSLSRFKHSFLYLVDLSENTENTEVLALKKKLFNIDVDLIYQQLNQSDI